MHARDAATGCKGVVLCRESSSRQLSISRKMKIEEIPDSERKHVMNFPGCSINVWVELNGTTSLAMLVIQGTDRL